MSFIFENSLCGQSIEEISMETQIIYILGLIPDCIVLCYTLFIFLNCNICRFYITIGILSNILLNFVLKLLIRNPRPKESCLTSFGFPSGDVQSIAFVAYFLYQDAINLIKKSKYGKDCRKPWILFVIITSVSIEAISRVLLKHHTIVQVISGILIGFVFALIWKKFTIYIMNPKRKKIIIN